MFVGQQHSNENDVFTIRADGTDLVNLTPGSEPLNALYPAWAPDGSSIAFFGTSGAGFSQDVFTVSPDGGELRNVSQSGHVMDCLPCAAPYSWAPDGSSIAFAANGSNGADIYEVTPTGTNKRQLTTDGGFKAGLSWSPDGRKIVFQGCREEACGQVIYDMNADGTGRRLLTPDTACCDFYPSWSPDGTMISFVRAWGPDNQDIYVMRADGSSQRNLTNNGSASLLYAPHSWAPDSQKIAYENDPTGDSNRGNENIHIVSIDGVDTPLTSGDGMNIDPAWHPSKDLIAFTRNGQLYLASVTTGEVTKITPELSLTSSNPSWSPVGKTDLTDPPVVFVHGIDWRGSGEWSIWGPAKDAIVRWGWRRQQLRAVGYYVDDKGFDATIDYYGKGKGAFRKHSFHYGGPTEHTEGNQHNNDTDIRHLAYHWAWYVYREFSSKSLAIKAVGHSMGGLIIRYALHKVQKGNQIFPPKLLVDEVVTLGTPHGGTGQVEYCSGRVDQCKQMRRGDEFIKDLKESANNPQASGGTEWTIIGSYADGALNPDESAVDDDMDAAQRVMYLEEMRVGHSDYYKDVFDDRDADVRYVDHANRWKRSAASKCNDSPWPVRWVFLTLSTTGSVAPCG